MTDQTATAESLRYPGGDGTEIAARRWRPDGPPRGIVQLAHGMGEHILRYGDLARRLTGAGFVVAGQDHRGHGATAAPGALGQIGEDGWVALVDDIHRLTGRLRADHPGLPLILLGHSMGSFAAQQNVLEHSDELDGLALTGTAAIDLLEPALDLAQPMDLTMFNAAFQPERTPFDWLSRDEAVVDAYLADPLCGFGIDTGAAKAMFAGARPLADPERVSAIRPDLPVYLAVGELDPVNGGLALFTPLVERLRAAGVRDLTTHVYPGARHEVLNETNRDEVIGDLLGWLNRVTAAGSSTTPGGNLRKY